MQSAQFKYNGIASEGGGSSGEQCCSSSCVWFCVFIIWVTSIWFCLVLFLAENPLQLHTAGFREDCALHVFLFRLHLCCDYVTLLQARNATALLSCLYNTSCKWNTAAYKFYSTMLTCIKYACTLTQKILQSNKSVYSGEGSSDA